MIEGRQYRAGHQPRSPCPLRRGREKHDRVRAVAAVMVEIVLDDADMAEAKPVGLLGKVERFLKILFARLLLGPDVREKLHAELHQRPAAARWVVRVTRSADRDIRPDASRLRAL